MMGFVFWGRVTAVNVNRVSFGPELRGKTKGELADEFRDAGFVDKTKVLLRTTFPSASPTSEVTTFGEVSSDAIYRGRTNKITGRRGEPHGFIHSFDKP